MEVNEVVVNGVTELSLVNDTVSEDTLLENVTAHDASGKQITGKVVAVPVDSELNAESENAVQNKAVAEALQNVEFLDLTYRTEIPENSNLDDYKTTGSFSVLVAAIAATITNSPVTTAGYYLDVRNRSSNAITQRATLWTGQEYTRYFNGTVWSAWWNSRNAATVNTQALSAPTTAFTPYYPAFVDSNNSSAAAEALKTNTAYRFQMKGGTADAEGVAQILLGNTILAGTDGNMKGQLVFFNNANAYYATLNPSTAQTGNVTFILPATGGTLALDLSKAKLTENSEGGNLRLTSPDGTLYMEQDCYNNTMYRCYAVKDGETKAIWYYDSVNNILNLYPKINAVNTPIPTIYTGALPLTTGSVQTVTLGVKPKFVLCYGSTDTDGLRKWFAKSTSGGHANITLTSTGFTFTHVSNAYPTEYYIALA